MIYPSLIRFNRELENSVKILDAIYKKEEEYSRYNNQAVDLEKQIAYLRLQENAIAALLGALGNFEKNVDSYLRDVDWYVKGLLRSLRGSKDKNAAFTRQQIRELGESIANKAAKLAKFGILIKHEGAQIAREE